MKEHKRQEDSLGKDGEHPAEREAATASPEVLWDVEPKARHADDLRRGDPPPATRLNRLAVVVAAAIMSATLLIIAFAVGGEGDEEAQARKERADVQNVRRATSGRTFFDHPLSTDTLTGADDFVTGLYHDEDAASYYDAGAESADDGLSTPAGMIPPPYGRIASSGGSPSPYGSSGPYRSTPHTSQLHQPSMEEQALERAKTSALIPQGLGAPGQTMKAGNLPGSRYAGFLEGATDPVEPRDAAYLRTLSTTEDMVDGTMRDMSPWAAASATGGPSDGVLQTGRQTAHSSQPVFGSGTAIDPSVRAEQFVGEAVSAREAGGRYIATAIDRPISPYEVREGTLVEAYLATGVHSDLPGEVVAQVSRNVYDSETQQVLLIPRGTRLIGSYDNQIAVDQSRLLVAWTRMIFPDGRSVTLPGLRSKDGVGMSGLTGRINRHYWRAFGNALMLAVVGGSLSYGVSRSRSPAGTFGYPTPGEVMAASVATELSRVATEILRGSVMRRPTIQIPAGTKFNVFMNGDLALGPYVPEDRFMEWGSGPAPAHAILPVKPRQ